MKKIIIICIIVAVVIGLVFGIFFTQRTEHRSQMHMGTLCEITLVDRSSTRRDQAFHDAFRLIEISEKSMSVFDPESDVTRINEHAFREPVHVAADVFFVIEKSIFFSQMTRGAFDITTLPLSELWGFSKHHTVVPPLDDIKTALSRVGYKNIKLGKDLKGKQFVELASAGVKIDLGGIAKGYICDLVVTSLIRNGIEHALVNIGGTIYAFGKPMGRKQWNVGIRDPRDTKKIDQTVYLDESAIATSGDYEQFFMHEGKRYSHILNPKTGYPVEDVISVTVRAPSAMVADALSTGIFVLGIEEGIRLADRLVGVEAYIVYQDNNTVQTVQTDNFPT